MSVRQTHYSMVGVMLPDTDMLSDDMYDEYTDNGYKQEIGKSKDGFTLIYDGMNGKYVIFGIILKKGLEHEGMPFTVFQTIKQSVKDKIAKKVKSLFGINMSTSKIKNMTFTHWH